MGRVRRMDMNSFKQPVYKVGEIAEKTVGIKETPVEPNRPINQVGKTPPRPGKGKRPPVKGEPLPVPPESEITSPVEKNELTAMPEGEPISPVEKDAVEQQPKRRRRRAQDQSLLNTNNLLGTGGSL